jgi:hypothetical protein
MVRSGSLTVKLKYFVTNKILTTDYIPKAYIYSEIFIVCGVKMYI